MTNHNDIQDARDRVQDRIGLLQSCVDQIDKNLLGTELENLARNHNAENKREIKDYQIALAALDHYSAAQVDVEGLHSKIDMDIEDHTGLALTLHDSKMTGLAIEQLRAQGYLKKTPDSVTKPDLSNVDVEALKKRMWLECAKDPTLIGEQDSIDWAVDYLIDQGIITAKEKS